MISRDGIALITWYEAVQSAYIDDDSFFSLHFQSIPFFGTIETAPHLRCALSLGRSIFVNCLLWCPALRRGLARTPAPADHDHPPHHPPVPSTSSRQPNAQKKKRVRHGPGLARTEQAGKP